MSRQSIGACAKVRYPSRALAWAALDRVDASSVRLGGKKETVAYRCRRCGGWHTTSQIRRRWQGRATA